MNEENNNRSISKLNSGFPSYLDFGKLRSEGISYLGELSGKIWTDHNVHDPGITILEVLCYALIDLGYRTNIPIVDLLAPPEESKDEPGSFFSPAQILSNNPLTITDFRKLLIDIDEVNNAWLEVATDIKADDLCREDEQPRDPILFRTMATHTNTRKKEECCETYLNGIYRVYIDLDQNLEKLFAGDPDGRKDYEDKVKDKISSVLAAHRNLCEDFLEPILLEKAEIGVCANIEVEDFADADTVYLALTERLQYFLSPTPRFYTLPQLLHEKKKNMEEIFAGRPLIAKSSHGFLDTEELENLPRRKVIHVSDIYNVLLQVKGIKTVRSVSIRSCDNKIAPGGKDTKWKYIIPKDHIPVFSTKCSGFNFYKQGLRLTFDQAKHEYFLQMRRDGNAKVPFKVPSPYLDLALEKGTYRKGINEYYSIQHDFPKVYGIAKGALPNDVSDARKAQALQLKGYLLFFDQLLANYVAQLSEVRKLFAFKNGDENQRSYFSAIPESVPDLAELLRFNASTVKDRIGGLADRRISGLADKGQGKEILAYPISLSKLNGHIKNDTFKKADIGKEFPLFDFGSSTENRLAMAMLQSDFMNDAVKSYIISKGENCFYYYFLSSSSELALMGKRSYDTEREAMDKASEVLYTGKFEESYSTFSLSNGSRYTFDIETDLSSYGRYLEMITENKELFTQRRHQFLDHLLSRFAESFTEFAILNYKHVSVGDAKLNGMAENFLSAYPELSSNRGRAYDYRLNGWNNENLSGLEKKFRALTGINIMLRKSLCHFEVFKHEKQFLYKLVLANQKLFYSDEKFDSPEGASAAASKLFGGLADPGNFEVAAIPEQPELYRLNVDIAGRSPVHSFAKYPDEASAQKAIALYSSVFSGKADPGQVYISQYNYRATLRNEKDEILQTLMEEPDSKEKAEKISIRNINAIKSWTLAGDPVHGKLAPFDKEGNYFIDTDAFKADINNTIIGKPELFAYDILDKGNRFKFSSLKEFITDKSAKEDYQQLIRMMANENNIRIDDEEKNSYSINVWQGNEKLARYAKEFTSRRKAAETRDSVIEVIRTLTYHIVIEAIPDRYNFRFVLGTQPGKEMTFDYVAEDFSSPADALKKSAAFRDMIRGMELREMNDEYFLVHGKAKNIAMARLVMENEERLSKESIENARKELSVLGSIRELKSVKSPEAFRFASRQDELSDCGEYGYRLVDNDHMLAFSLREGKLHNLLAAEQYIKDLLTRCSNGYQWLSVSMGGDIVRERKDKAAKTSFYHYQVKTQEAISNYNNTSYEIVTLFESVQGYTSREDAEKAFTENIYDILDHAAQLKFYGKGNYISDQEIFDNAGSGDCGPSGSVVYIPSKTMSFMGSYPDDAFRKMEALAMSFPIKIIYPKFSEEERKKYNDMFPCTQVDSNEEECRKGKGKPLYYFVLMQDSQAIWQSVKSYDTAKEAQREFDFFFMLLGYYGNYKLDCDPCSQRYTVFIREVLAESTRRYETEEAAWGADGIEQFICVAQSDNAFHHYMNREDCLHHFYVACSNTPLVHPCTYETPLLRDQAMNRLRRAADKKGYGLPEIITDNGEKILLDTEGNRIAIIQWEGRRIASKECEDERVEIFHLMLTRELEDVEGRLRISINDTQRVIFSPLFDDIEKSEAFRKRLVCTALYFPILTRESVINGRLHRKFCLEVRFPGIRDCYEGGYRENPCGCEEDFPGDDCDIAWKSDCCFDTCEEAMTHFRRHMDLLLDYRNYRAIDDCPCGPYRVALHEWPGLKDCRARVIKPEWIIALNPQRYPSSEMACEAVERAKRLINDEGLHLAEHILLRPKTADECICSRRRGEDAVASERRGEVGRNAETQGGTGCEFRWTNPGDPDQCIDPLEVCFVPGEDPYSFIATVVLPAWPERYRSEDNREIIEMLLRKEAPAHVLLRILWVTPHDLCRYETMFKKWQLSLANKDMCGDQFDYCAFIDLLFRYRWEHLGVCNFCKPCEEPSRQLPCEEVKAVERYHPKRFLRDTDELFEWRNPRAMLMGKLMGTPIMGTSLPTETAAPVIEPEKDLDAVIKKSKPAFVNQRRSARKQKMTGLMSELKKLAVVGEVASFLEDTHPDAARLDKISAKLLTGIKAVKGKRPSINKKYALELFELAVHHYLDKQVFNGKDVKKINAIADSLDRFASSGLDIVGIHKNWQPAEVGKYESKMPLDTIKKLFLDKS